MGWMGGLGKGMMKYSDTLGEQRKMDWEADQARLKDQRAMNLENLRIGAQDARQTKQNEFTAGQQTAQNTYNEGIVDKQNTYNDGKQAAQNTYQEGVQATQNQFLLKKDAQTEAQRVAAVKGNRAWQVGRENSALVTPDGKPINNATLEKMGEAEKAKLITQADFEDARATARLLDVATTKRIIAAEDRLEVANGFRAFYGDEITPAAETIAMALEQGVDLKMIMGEKGKPPTGEQLKAANDILATDEIFKIRIANQN